MPTRCFWCEGDALYERYHDEEWGVPVTGDDALFELLSLELMQSGLSFLTILKKREGFRRAFAGFAIPTVARFDARKVARLVEDAAIVRHRGKIEAVIANARAARALTDEGGSLATLVWAHAPARAVTTGVAPEAKVLAKELKARGFRFLGPTTLYAAMQAGGLVNDHAPDCHRRAAVERLQARQRRALAGG